MKNQNSPVNPFSFYIQNRKKPLATQEVTLILRYYRRYSQEWLRSPLWRSLEQYPELKDWLPHKNLNTEYTKFILRQFHELAVFIVLTKRISKLPVIMQDLQASSKIPTKERIDLSGFRRHHCIPQYLIKELSMKYSNFPKIQLTNCLENVPYLTPIAHIKAHEIMFVQFGNFNDCTAAKLLFSKLPMEYRTDPESQLGLEVLANFNEAQRQAGALGIGIAVQKERGISRFNSAEQKRKSDMARNNPEDLAKIVASGKKGNRIGKAKGRRNRSHEDSVALGLKGGRSFQQGKTIQSDKTYLFYREEFDAFFTNYNLPKDIATE